MLDRVFEREQRERSGNRSVSILCALLLLLASAVVAQAGTPMYVLGKLTIPSFGNDTTTGTTPPFYSTNYLGVPFGQNCNSAHGTGTTVCYATSYYQSAHDGSPLLGTGVLSVSAGDFTIPEGVLSVKLGEAPTVFTSANFVKQGTNGVPGGSFSYYPPYIYSYTYADLKNAAGNFFGGGGPGDFIFRPGASGAGTLETQEGAGKFGGTMGMLGFFQTHFAYAIVGGLSVGTDDWLVHWLGNGTVTPGGSVNVLTLTDTATNKNNVLMQTNTAYHTASAFPWTTGFARVDATAGPFYTKMARSGYDNRTAGGAGNIQMVSPMLTHWRTPAAELDYETGSIGVLTLEFVPEPSHLMLLVGGVSLLGLAYRSSRRG